MTEDQLTRPQRLGIRPPDPHPDNVNLASDVISPLIRVSTAAIFNDAHFGCYWQLETFIFSDDPALRTTQRIHCTMGAIRELCWADHGYSLAAGRAVKVHNHIVKNLKETHK